MNGGVGFLCVIAAILLSVPAAAQPDEWFKKDKYDFDPELELDYDLPPVVDHDFDYIKKPFSHPSVEDVAIERVEQIEPSDRWAVIKGRIDSAKHMELGGSVCRNSILKVELTDGRSHLVDFGSALTNPDFRLTPGSRLAVHGEVRKLNGRNMLFANEVQIGKVTYGISHRTDPRRDGAQTIRGTLDEFQRVFFHEGGVPRALVRLRFQDGRTCLLDIGRDTSWRELGLKEDALVVIHGWKDSIDGRFIIRAEQIMVNGVTVILN